MGHGPRPARAAVHLLQQMSAQRRQEPHGLLRARPVSESRRHDRRADDDLCDAPDAQPAAGRFGEGRLGELMAVAAEPPVTYVEGQLRRRRRLLLPLLILLVLLLALA